MQEEFSLPKTNTSSSAKAGKTAALYRTAKAVMLFLILLCKTVFAIFCAFRRKLSYDFWELFWKKPKTLLTNPKLCVILTRQNTKPYRGVEQSVARRAHNPEVRWFKSPPRNQKRKQSIGLLSFLERCVPHAERDAHFVRDDGFAL